MTATTSRPHHTNRLIDSTSPYLLQHAHNPVDWYPWGDEALVRAKAEDKPIFLSIGYSACHWCHVMERESFEDEEIARILNRHFVAIKVDREERPDLDDIYMNATMIYNRGHGGWPMSVFLTPDRKPFFAGTYFPPRSVFGRPGFLEILTEIARLWAEERPRLLQGADALTDAVRRAVQSDPGTRLPALDVLAKAAEAYARLFDADKGGILSGAANKFPPSMTIQLLLRQHRRSAAAGRPRSQWLDLCELTLERMARGGIYDHLGGGICRYSTDPDWLVPHFEKMLYDQALVADAYLDAFLLTQKPLYAETARGICDFVIRDLRLPCGGFASALDADSEGQEGKYYVWTLDEIRTVLGEADAALFAAFYDVTEAGNWHDAHGHAPPGPKNILNIPRGPDVVAKLHRVSEADLRTSLESSRRKLLDVRRRRVPPATDDKVLTAWNGLMITTLAKASCVLAEPRFRDAAVTAAEFIRDTLTRDGRLLRTFRAGRAHIGGYLDDHAFFAEACIHLYEATFDPRWLGHALRLTEQTLEHFGNAADGAFFFTADDAEQHIVRPKDTGDSAVPAGSSVLAMNLLRLAVMLDRPDLRTRAEAIFKSVAGRIDRSPLGVDRLLAALDFYAGPVTEIVIAGPPDDAATKALIDEVWRHYLPNKVVLLSDAGAPGPSAWAGELPLLKDRRPIDGRPTAYVCENRACRRPVTSPEDLAEQLR